MKSWCRLLFTAGILLVLCPSISFAQKKSVHSASAKTPTGASTANSPGTAAVRQLEKLCDQLKQKNSSAAYNALSGIANQKASPLATRAALALGFYDYSRTRYADAEKWLERAKRDPLLADYALYWSAETELAQAQDAPALAELKQVRQDYPDSVMTEQVAAGDWRGCGGVKPACGRRERARSLLPDGSAARPSAASRGGVRKSRATGGSRGRLQSSIYPLFAKRAGTRGHHAVRVPARRRGWENSGNPSRSAAHSRGHPV